MLQVTQINPLEPGELRATVLEEAKKQLNMNLSLLEMLKGNTSLEDLANLRELWVKPYMVLVRELEGKH